MGFFIDAGKLDKPVEVLELKQVSAGVWEWCRVRRAWASVEPGTGRNLFSSVGIGKRDWRLVLRRQGISLHNAVRWGTRHFFLTGITEPDRGHLELGAALVTVENCTAVRTEDTVGEGNRPVTAEAMRIAFPAVLTEKYIRYEREDTHDETEQTYVLVTPKAILLQSGDLVTVQAGSAKGTYYVTAPHILDEYKNEYEIVRRGDV